MNRILFEKAEIVGATAVMSGARAEHVMNVLHGEVGQPLKTGEIDGLVGTSEIISIDRDMNGAPLITVRIAHTQNAPMPWVDVILAPPRPRILKRLLPQMAALGVGRIVLVGSQKVEKDFWGATLLKEENYRPLFVDGLMQAGTSALPTLEVRRNFRAFMRDELEAAFTTTKRLVAHPYGMATQPTMPRPSAEGRLLLAIGPEGGWTDEEVALLETHGFVRYSLGKRILRTDTATVALLARLMEEYSCES